MHDDKEVAIQIVDPAQEQNEKLIVMVKQFHPDTWQLDAPVEVWLDRNASLDDFSDALAT